MNFLFRLFSPTTQSNHQLPLHFHLKSWVKFLITSTVRYYLFLTLEWAELWFLPRSSCPVSELCLKLLYESARIDRTPVSASQSSLPSGSFHNKRPIHFNVTEFWHVTLPSGLAPPKRRADAIPGCTDIRSGQSSVSLVKSFTNIWHCDALLGIDDDSDAQGLVCFLMHYPLVLRKCLSSHCSRSRKGHSKWRKGRGSSTRNNAEWRTGGNDEEAHVL